MVLKCPVAEWSGIQMVWYSNSLDFQWWKVDRLSNCPVFGWQPKVVQKVQILEAKMSKNWTF